MYYAIVEGTHEAAAQKPAAGFKYFANLLQPVKENLESDITIIGGGPGGYVAAIQAAKLGARVIVVEKDRLGGTCLNRGCIPTKSLVRSAEIYRALREADGFGAAADNVRLDMKKVLERKNIMGQHCEMNYRVVPSAIFTDPEIAMVGLTEKAAQKEDREVIIGKFPFAANGKALTQGESRGFVKILADKATGQVLGGGIIGSHATDLIATIALAVQNKLTVEQIAETIHAHPTTAEAIHEAGLAAMGGAIHFAM